jgi:hypothetical protein
MLRVKVDAPLDQVKRLEGVFAARYAGEYLEVETAHPEHTLQALAVTNGRGMADFNRAPAQPGGRLLEVGRHSLAGQS